MQEYLNTRLVVTATQTRAKQRRHVMRQAVVLKIKGKSKVHLYSTTMITYDASVELSSDRAGVQFRLQSHSSITATLPFNSLHLHDPSLVMIINKNYGETKRNAVSFRNTLLTE